MAEQLLNRPQIAPRRFYDYKLSSNGRQRHFGIEDDDYFTRVVNGKAARIAARLARRKRPFYLQVDHLAPHKGGGDGAGVCKNAALPDRRDLDAFPGEPLPGKAASLNESDPSDKPPFVRALPELSEEELDALREAYRCGLASLLAVDRGVKRIFEAVRRAGEVGDTAFVFTSDHGYLFGEHRLTDLKHYPYEEAIRIPLVIRLPKRHGGESPLRSSAAPVANIDLVPTILRLAQAQPCRRSRSCRTMDGRSLLGLLRAGTAPWADDRGLALEIDLPAAAPPAICRYRGVRAGDQLYVRYESLVDEETGECVATEQAEHYDLGSDPAQLTNLYPDVSGSLAGLLQAQLALRAAALSDCAGIAGRDPAPRGRSYCE